MTGFARAEGQADGFAWAWELRSVNGRGLDLRLRLPPGTDALEPALREAAGKALKRGNVSANLTIKREEVAVFSPDPVALEQALKLALDLAARIPGAPPPRAESLLRLPGVLRSGTAETETPIPAVAIQQGFATALDQLITARQAGHVGEQAAQIFHHPRPVRRRLIGGFHTGLGVQGSDFRQLAAQDLAQPGALGLAGGDELFQGTSEALLDRGGGEGGIGLGRPAAQHAGQAEQGFGARRRRAGDAGGEVEGKLQGLLQRHRVGAEHRDFLALDREVGTDIAALQRLADGLAHGRFQRIGAGGQAQAQIEATAIDAAQFPGPGEAVGLPFGAGEAGHGGERCAHGGHF